MRGWGHERHDLIRSFSRDLKIAGARIRGVVDSSDGRRVARLYPRLRGTSKNQMKE